MHHKRMLVFVLVHILLEDRKGRRHVAQAASTLSHT